MVKPVVHYTGQAYPFLDRAMLKPVDHPNHLEEHNVSNQTSVYTSRVLSWDEETGVIETKNTIYVPKVEDVIS